MAARLEAWLRGEREYPTKYDPARNHPLYDTACKVDPADFDAVDDRTIEDCKAKFGTFVPGDFQGFPTWLDQPVEISALDAPPLADGDLTMVKDALAEERAVACAASGFIPWAGGDGPPADWDRGEVLLDWEIGRAHV